MTIIKNRFPALYPDGANAASLHSTLDRLVAVVRKNRFHRLMTYPGRLLWSKALEVGLCLTGRSRNIESETFWGDKMRLVFPEVVSLSIYRYGFFDDAMTKIFLHHLKPGMTVFDVGAHFGYFTLLASRLVGQSGTVHSFEPTPGSYALLRMNAGDRPNVLLNNLAVDVNSACLEFLDYGPRFSAFNSFGTPRLSERETASLRPSRITVNAVSLDEYAAGRICPKFVKIDAEGAEIRILSGMENLIRQCRPAIALEVGDFNVPGVPPSRDVIQFLFDRDYEAFEYREGRIVRHDIRVDYSDGNILFLPK